MRIEKINDNRIRCFLSREDMESRQLHLKELAYGTEKARALFHEILNEARSRFGFEAENMPVMVEAVPLQDDSLVLIITKVDNPEELDTRFSNFSPSVKSGSADPDVSTTSALSQLLEAIRQEMDRGAHEENGQEESGAEDTSQKAGGKKPAGKKPAGKKASTAGRKKLSSGMHLFTFPSMGEAASAAAAAPGFQGRSSLYRDPADSTYYLFVSPPEGDAPDFGQVLSALSEFGREEYITPAREQYLREHCEVLCAEDAVRKLSEIGNI
ncbi:MAG: adaptor protein MecA [Eubacteriales bacterium]|jgi:adapter protein MecA 1/2|nr:adaptor protein MecA [Eubacteriales bacterium]